MNYFFKKILLVSILLSAAFTENLVAQKKLKGTGYNRKQNDSSFQFTYNRDTINDGVFTSKYKIFNVAGFSGVDIIHFQSEQRIDIIFSGGKNSSPIKRVIKYKSNGAYIFIDFADTVKFDVNRKYRLVFFFDNTDKDRFVLLHQISILIEEHPKLCLKLDDIPAWLIKENWAKVEYYLLKGTPDRRIKYAIYLDNLKNEKRLKWKADSLTLGNRLEYAIKRKAINEKRDTVTLSADAELVSKYTTIVRKEIIGVIEDRLANDEIAYYNSTLNLNIDTSGNLINFSVGNGATDISNSKSFVHDLKNRISGQYLPTMIINDDSGVVYTMATKIQLAVNFKKQTNIVRTNVYKKAEPKITGFTLSNQKFRTILIDSLKKMNKGKYRMTIDYRNVLGDTSYLISKLKNISDKVYLKIGISFGTFMSQTGSSPINYNGDLNFPYLNFYALYKFGGVFFGSNMIPVFGTTEKGVSFDEPDFIAIGNPVSTYNTEMKYSEFGIYASPSNLLYLKIGMAIQKNTQVIYNFSDKTDQQFCYQNINNSSGLLIGVALAPKFFTLEAGYNTLINKPFFNIGINLPINLK